MIRLSPSDGTVTTPGGTHQCTSPLGAPTDVEGDSLTYSIVTGPTPWKPSAP